MVCCCVAKRLHLKEACESPPLHGGLGPSNQDRYVDTVLQVSAYGNETRVLGLR